MLNDTLTISLVLVLLFGSVALYLYTCIQQSEQKINLLESILLDLKMSAEVSSYTELPVENTEQAVSSGGSSTPTANNSYVPFEDPDEAEHDTDSAENLPASIKLVDEVEINDSTVIAVEQPASDSSAQYEAMSLKELQTLAKSRGIVGVTKKGPLIEALKTSDRSSAVKPGSMTAVGSNSFLETSAPVSDESA
jgi:hypothetical protein